MLTYDDLTTHQKYFSEQMVTWVFCLIILQHEPSISLFLLQSTISSSLMIIIRLDVNVALKEFRIFPLL